MNNNKIAFITLVNNERAYKECNYYIDNLLVPDGMTIEKISIRKAKSMTSGYNEAIKKTDAKYKVYIHQDCFILEKDIIITILEVFKKHNIGMIGFVGCKNMPKSAMWWKDESKVGAIYDNHTGKMKKYSYLNETGLVYTKVAGVDGVCMVTQYDIEWQENIFDGWHFYDISQCMEFMNKDYEVVVINQNKPWLLHECGGVININGYEKYQKIFLEYYNK